MGTRTISNYNFYSFKLEQKLSVEQYSLDRFRVFF